MQSTELDTLQLINSLNTALVMVDSKLVIVYANHAGEALFETGRKQLVGHPLPEFFLPGTIETTRLKAAIRKGEDFTENEIKLAFRDNRYVSADLTVTNIQIDGAPRLLFEVKKIDNEAVKNKSDNQGEKDEQMKMFNVKKYSKVEISDTGIMVINVNKISFLYSLS